MSQDNGIDIIPLAQVHWAEEQRPPRRLTTPSSLMFDGTGQFHLEYATPPRPMTKRQLFVHYFRKLDDSVLKDAIDLFGGPMKVTLAIGCALMLFGGNLRSAWAAGTVITVGMLMVEAVVVIWAKTK